MSWKQEKLKKALQDKIEARVEEMLKGISDDRQLSLTEIEELVLEARQEIGQVMTQAVAEVESQPLEPDVNCPACGRKMQHKGKKPKQLTTQSGEIVIERDYCYCPDCRAGLFPPG